MDKASKALRRSRVRLKSISSGHRDLNMVISELKDVRSTAKAFITAQNAATQDLLKWSSNDENEAIQETFMLLSELNSLWTHTQKEFIEHFKEFIYQFEMILEGEHQVDHARNHVSNCELRETKIKKELKKAVTKLNVEDVTQLEVKLVEAEQSKNVAQAEVLERIQENEGVKVIRTRDGLLKLSDSYLELAHKCIIIHEAHRDIADQLPNIQNKNIHEVKCKDSRRAKEALSKAKDLVYRYGRHPTDEPCAPPPPYSPGGCSDNSPFNPHYEAPQYYTSHPGIGRSVRRRSSNISDAHYRCSNTNPFEENELNHRFFHSPEDTHGLDRRNQVLWQSHYESDLSEGMGRVKT